MSDFKKLQVWEKAHALSLSVDRMSKRIRGTRYASLRNQIFRAATSIPANIAEGRRQVSEKEFARFLGYALNSASELEYHLILARDTEVIPKEDFTSLLGQTITVRKMLYGLLKRLASASATAPTEPSPQPPAAPPTVPAGRREFRADSSSQHSVADRRQPCARISRKRATSDYAYAPARTDQ